MNFQQWKHFYCARFFTFLKRPDQAAEEYLQALKHNPSFFRAVSGLAFLYATNLQFSEAEEYFRKALSIKSNDANTLFNLGFVREKLGNRASAIEAFEEAVRINPALDRAWYGLGMTYAAMQRHEEAAKALEEAAHLQSMNPHAWYLLGMAYHALHNHDKVAEVVHHLHRFDPKMSQQLILDSGRTDLAHLIGT